MYLQKNTAMEYLMANNRTTLHDEAIPSQSFIL